MEFDYTINKLKSSFLRCLYETEEANFHLIEFILSEDLAAINKRCEL